MTSVPTAHGHQGVTVGSAPIFVAPLPKIRQCHDFIKLHRATSPDCPHQLPARPTARRDMMAQYHATGAYGIPTSSTPFLARTISWRAGSATPLCRARDVDKQTTISRWGIRARILSRIASPCPQRLRRREGLSDTFLFSSEYICANIPVGTYHPSPVFVGLFLLSLLRLLSSQVEDATDHSWHSE